MSSINDWVCQKCAHICTGESIWVERDTPLAGFFNCIGNVCFDCAKTAAMALSPQPEAQPAPAPAPPRATPLILTVARTGELVETDLTDAQAYELLRTDPREFPASLASSFVRYKSWTPNQRPWAHKLALEIKAKREAPVFDNTCGGARFTSVADHLAECALKRLTVSFFWKEREDGPEHEFSIERARTVSQGYALRWDRRCFGFLKPDGSIELRGFAPPIFAMATLDELEQDYVATVREHGRRAGRCCFCKALLTDDRSIEAGFGPVCAKSHRLPWGGKSNARKETAEVA